MLFATVVIFRCGPLVRRHVCDVAGRCTEGVHVRHGVCRTQASDFGRLPCHCAVHVADLDLPATVLMLVWFEDVGIVNCHAEPE